MTDFAVVIPVRMASERLPGKPLLDIEGRPMIAWVHERARLSGAGEVVVATDDERIAETCYRLGADVEMTAREHASGTDRIAEVTRLRQWPADRIVVNVQGDEPLLPPALIDQAADLLDANSSAGMATLMTPLATPGEYADPNMAKVVVSRDGFALYFSRAAIPARRDGQLPELARRHIGLYAYRVETLELLATTEPCELEQAERLEQLRALWLGVRIAIADAVALPPRGVDTAKDLELIRELAADPRMKGPTER